MYAFYKDQFIIELIGISVIRTVDRVCGLMKACLGKPSPLHAISHLIDFNRAAAAIKCKPDGNPLPITLAVHNCRYGQEGSNK